MSNSSIATTTHQELIHTLNQAVRAASTATALIHSALAESFGLNISDWKCGELVNRHGRLTAGQLAEMTGLTTGTITVIIDRLENARFVRRVTDAKDRRKVWVEATDERSAEVRQQLDDAFRPILEWMASYSDEQLILILAFTQRTTDLTLEAAARLRQSIVTSQSPLKSAQIDHL